MSFVIAAPEAVASAASDLAGIGSTPSAAHVAAAAPTTGIMAEDEVSAAIAGPAPAGLAAPPHPAPPAPTKARGISRRATIALIAVALVAVIGISACGKHRPSQSSSSPRSYGAQVVLPFTGLQGPRGVAVDSAGTVYVTDDRGQLLKLSAGSTSSEALPGFTDFVTDGGVAVDSAGNLYVSQHAGKVLKLAAGSTSPEVLPIGGSRGSPAVAVDAAGTVYVTSFKQVVGRDEAYRVVEKLAAGSSSPEVLPPPAGPKGRYTRSFPGVAVDSAGNVYVTDNKYSRNDDPFLEQQSRVLKLPAGSSTWQVLPFNNIEHPDAFTIPIDGPEGVAVDSAGNIYVVDGGQFEVLKLPAGSTTPEVLPFHQPDPSGFRGVAVDSAGNVYVADASQDQVLKLPVQ